MKKYILFILLIISLFLAPKALAEWKRLKEVGVVRLDRNSLWVVHDEVANRDCYVAIGDGYSNSIDLECYEAN